MLAVGALAFTAGCKTDDAAEKDLKNATEDVRQAGKDAGNKLDKAADDVGRETEKAVPGDSDGDGK